MKKQFMMLLISFKFFKNAIELTCLIIIFHRKRAITSHAGGWGSIPDREVLSRKNSKGKSTAKRSTTGMSVIYLRIWPYEWISPFGHPRPRPIPTSGLRCTGSTGYASRRHTLWCDRLVNRLEKLRLHKIDFQNRKSYMF